MSKPEVKFNWVEELPLISKKWFLPLIVFIFAAANFSCAERSIDKGLSGAGLKTIAASEATIETPANVELATDRLASVKTGVGSWGCTYNATGSNSGTESTSITLGRNITTAAMRQANLFTPTTYMKIQSVTLKLRREAFPQGDFRIELKSTSGSDPDSGSPLQQTAWVDMQTLSDDANGSDVNLALQSAYEVSGNTSYALVLRPNDDPLAGTVLDALNVINWLVNNAAGGGCTNFPIYRSSINAGSAWSDSFNATYRRSYFLINADQHASSGSASWILSAFPTAQWKMSTFQFSENPSGLTAGTITYDVGAGDSSSTPSYSYTGLSLAQVQALTNLQGWYFYVRANFAVSSPYFDKAELGNGSIEVQ